MAAREAQLMRKLGEARRKQSAKDRLARLQKKTKFGVGMVIRPVEQRSSETLYDKV